jgi:hypothetical protein
LDQNRRLEVQAAFVVVLDTIAVFPRRESGCRPLTGIDPTECLCGLEIDHQLEGRRLHHRQVLRAAERASARRNEKRLIDFNIAA